MSLSQKEVTKVADLARLQLTDTEMAQYQAQLSAILDYVVLLDDLDLTDIPPTSRAVPQENVWREDIAEPCLPTEAALQNAPQQAQNQFLIQSILVGSQ